MEVKLLIERLRTLSAENPSPRDCIDEAADALEKMDALLRVMQSDAVAYLVPDNDCGMDWFVNRMLGHLDGPQQRNAQKGIYMTEMEMQMIRALAEIDRELGMPDDGCNSTENTITAIRLLHAVRRDDEAEIERLRIGHDRYETARRIPPRQWADVWKLNTTTGKPFDEIIDDMRPFMVPNAPKLTGRGTGQND